MALSSRKKTQNRRKTNERTLRQSSDWAVLFYIAGDLKDDPNLGPKSLASSLQDDVQEILKAGGSRDVQIALQHDHPESGASRYLLPNHSARTLEPTIRLGNVDSGNPEVLADFLRWGLSHCPAKRFALVLGGFSALDPAGVGGNRKERVLTICRDDSAGGYLDVVDLGKVIRRVLNEFNRDKLELLAIDSCQTQFMELAYELEGYVDVLLAPQNLVPNCGWNYTKVLQTWKNAAKRERGNLDAVLLARELVPIIIGAYGESKKTDKLPIGVNAAPFFVSALDLRRLDDVAQAFDTLCIGMFQVLGEGLIWEARNLVLSLLNPDISRPKGAARKREHRVNDAQASQAIDCGSLFALLAFSLEAFADESIQGWLAVALQRGPDAALDRFRTVAAQCLEKCVDEKNKDLENACFEAMENEPIQAWLGWKLKAGEFPEDCLVRSIDLDRLRKWAQALRNNKPEQMLKQLQNGIRERVTNQADWKGQRSRAKIVDHWFDTAIRKASRLMPEARQVEYARQCDAAASALRLAKQARLCSSMLFGKKPDQDALADAREATGLVVAAASTEPPPVVWPYWSGVSLYRPEELDDLMSPGYQGFRFHKRIHWAALLGATNLIQFHPRALWRLISSLLATGSAITRRDLLQRLTGPDSVIWGLRDQFRVMAPARTLTLSLEQRRLTRTAGINSEDGSTSNKTKKLSTRENFLLRLESASSGAVINEQRSRVQPKVMDRALRELDSLLNADVTNAESLGRLRAIGGLLGDDIFQILGRTLEDERLKALEEADHITPHLQFQIPRSLMRYPWELLHHHGKWLSEQFAIGRQVFMETGMARRVSRRSRGRIRPLIIGDVKLDSEVAERWPQLPGARAEAEMLADCFDQLRDELGEMIDFDRVRDTRIGKRLTNQEFRDLLRHENYDIVHFAGHGQFDSEDAETSAWILSDGELWALEIRNTLANHPAPPWLVYANACEAGMESRGVPPRYQGNVFGLATAFLNQGVAAYVAPLWPINDKLAQQITIWFYRLLLSERVTLGEALRLAKSKARQRSEREGFVWGLGWASLVLYGDPTEELFQALAGSEKKTETAIDDMQNHVPPSVHAAERVFRELPPQS